MPMILLYSLCLLKSITFINLCGIFIENKRSIHIMKKEFGRYAVILNYDNAALIVDNFTYSANH